MSNKSLAKPHKETCILVTGGAGFIGSHTCVELLERGYRVVVVDDLSNSSETAHRAGARHHRHRRARAARSPDVLRGKHPRPRTRSTASSPTNDIDAIIHFAGFKAVGESVQKPLGILLEQRCGHPRAVRRGARGTDARTSCSRRAPRCTASPSSSPSPRIARSTRPRTRTARRRACWSSVLVRPVRWRRRMERRAAALLQPHRRARERAYRRGPQGHPQQPASLRGAGGRGQAGMRRRVRRRLSHA